MVWERFERGAHRFDAHIPGSGIGLPVARALVEAHGGTIRYERSQVLGGACFAFTIPAPGKEAPGMPQPRPAVTGA
jgi:signal transduction histidine kinase